MAVNFSDVLNTVVLGLDASGNIIANTNPVSYTHAYDNVNLGSFYLKAGYLGIKDTGSTFHLNITNTSTPALTTDHTLILDAQNVNQTLQFGTTGGVNCFSDITLQNSITALKSGAYPLYLQSNVADGASAIGTRIAWNSTLAIASHTIGVTYADFGYLDAASAYQSLYKIIKPAAGVVHHRFTNIKYSDWYFDIISNQSTGISTLSWTAGGVVYSTLAMAGTGATELTATQPSCPINIKQSTAVAGASGYYAVNIGTAATWATGNKLVGFINNSAVKSYIDFDGTIGQLDLYAGNTLWYSRIRQASSILPTGDRTLTLDNQNTSHNLKFGTYGSNNNLAGAYYQGSVSQQSQVVTSVAGVATVNWGTSNKTEITLSENITTLNFTAPFAPANLVLKLTLGGIGSYTISWPASIRWANGAPPVLSTTVGAVDLISFYWDGSVYLGSYGQGYAASGGTYGIVTVTAGMTPYTVTVTDLALIVNSATPVTINLPTAIGRARCLSIKSVGVGVASVTPNGAELIDGSNVPVALNQWDAADVFDYAASNWAII